MKTEQTDMHRRLELMRLQLEGAKDEHEKTYQRVKETYEAHLAAGGTRKEQFISEIAWLSYVNKARQAHFDEVHKKEAIQKKITTLTNRIQEIEAELNITSPGQDDSTRSCRLASR